MGLLDTSGFVPRWTCGQWTQLHGWIHVISDILIFCAYITIPLSIFFFIRKRKDIEFSNILLLFSLFILSCGITHLIEATIFWHPLYRLSGFFKVVTAIISIKTSYVLFKIMPEMLNYPSMIQLNKNLCIEIESRKRVENSLVKKNLEIIDLNEKLERKNKELQNFAHVASHDLQAPLRAINNFSQFIESEYNDKLDKNGKFYIKRILKNIKKMQALIKSLLIYATNDSNEIELNQTNLNETVEQAISLLITDIKSSNATIDIKKLPTLLVNSTQMTQVFINLISNGIKYNESDNPKIEISAIEEADYWKIFIKDNGIGIKKEYFDDIFNIFRRLHGEDKYEGSGVGLAICKKVICSHNGLINIESKPGEGSNFIISLPKQNMN